MPFVKCRFCSKQFSDRLSICPFCKRDVSDEVAITPPAVSSDNIAQTHTKRYVNPIIVVSVVVALGISFLGFKFCQNMERRNASREFSSLVGAVSGDLITLALRSEDVVNDINKEWRDAIFSEYKKRDFNEAIAEVRVKRSSEISSIKELSESIAIDIKKMNPPEGKEKDFQRLKELYLLFNKFADMAVSPSGSFQTYSQQNSALTVEIKSAIRELELMK
jgi:hypothetical protein